MFEPIPAILKRRHWLAFVTFVIPFTGAVVLAMTLPGLYRATATILVQRDQEPTDVETRLQTIREEVLSRQRLDAMVERFGLYPELRERSPMEAIIDRMRKDIQIQLKGPEQGAAPAGTIAFSIAFRGSDRDMTKTVANALAESYVQENLKIRGRQAKGTADALEVQLSEMRTRLDEQESRIGGYQAAHNGELPQQLMINLARMQQLEMQLQINRESRLRAAGRGGIAGGPTADSRYAENPGAPGDPAERLARLKQELSNLKTTYSDSYPDVARLKSEISSLESQQEEVPPVTTARRPKTAPVPTKDHVQTLESEEDRLRREISAYSARVDRAPQREQEFAQLSRDYSTTRDLYSSLLKRYQEAKIADDTERDSKSGQLRILDSAITPPGPYAPNRGRLMLFALLASLALAAGVVALAERFDTSFHTVDDLRSFTRVPVLVSIPPLRTQASNRKGRSRLAWLTMLTVTGIVVIAAAGWIVAHGNIGLVQLLARSSAS